jgi:hypothetical protein
LHDAIVESATKSFEDPWIVLGFVTSLTTYCI